MKSEAPVPKWHHHLTNMASGSTHIFCRGNAKSDRNRFALFTSVGYIEEVCRLEGSAKAWKHICKAEIWINGTMICWKDYRSLKNAMRWVRDRFPLLNETKEQTIERIQNCERISNT